MAKDRVVLDARLTRQMSAGMQTYVRELVARLPQVAQDIEFVAITNADLHTDAHIVRIAQAAARNVSVAEQVLLPLLIRRCASGRGRRIAHYMSVYAPRWSFIPYVYTVHDLIHRRFPEYFSWKIPPFYSLVAAPVAQRAVCVLTDAQATLPDLRRYLGLRRQRVRVVPLGVSATYALDDNERERRAERARAAHDLRRPYFLYAGNHRRHKNLRTLFKAWAAVSVPCDLVLTEGAQGSHYQTAYSSRHGGRVIQVGHLSEQRLVDVYAGASGVVQPSLYEGFGLSVLEAMAAGSPVLFAHTPALAEVAGNAAASFEPLDYTGLAAYMTQILGDEPLRARLQAAGRARAAAFTWDATAEQTAVAYRSALSVCRPYRGRVSRPANQTT